MNQPKINVIMSVYNGMPYLKEAVESILGQTYKNFEFIIIDDASIDGTWRYLTGLHDRRIKLMKNKKNLGLAKSLNKALRRAQGDYIARMDADDISLPRRFDIQVTYLEDNPQIDICGAFVKLINDEGDVIGRVVKPTNDAEIKKMNKWMPGLIHPTWLIRREVFERLKGYDSRYDMVEDYEFLLRAKNFQMANIAKILLLWRSPRIRRSRKSIEKMYRQSLALRLQHFKNGNFGIFYLPFLIRSFITTYLFPTKLKIYLNKKAGLI